MLVAPDTSPRVELPGDRDSWDFGIAAGFYLDATQAPWSRHYRMYSYVVDELPAGDRGELPRGPARSGIFGSLDGRARGADHRTQESAAVPSVSAFAPIAAPIAGALGQQGVQRIPGRRSRRWANTTPRSWSDGGRRFPDTLLVDQGTSDKFLEDQLSRSCWTTPARPPGSRSNCACTPATTTVTSSSRHSSPSTWTWHAKRLGAP